MTIPFGSDRMGLLTVHAPVDGGAWCSIGPDGRALDADTITAHVDAAAAGGVRLLALARRGLAAVPTRTDAEVSSLHRPETCNDPARHARCGFHHHHRLVVDS